jgi:hypothetical protein
MFKFLKCYVTHYQSRYITFKNITFRTWDDLLEKMK